MLEPSLLDQIRPELEAIKPMAAVFDQRYVKRLSGPNVKKGKNKLDLANQLIADIRAAGAGYNRSADWLAALERAGDGPAVSQVAVPANSRLVRRLSTDPGRIAESMRLGATAMASALYGESTRLMWRPAPLSAHEPIPAVARSAA